MANNLTYLDFAIDTALYLNHAFSLGLRYNDMVSQAQRSCECYMKNIIQRALVYDNDVMMSHNLRKLYEYIESLGRDLSPIRSDVMLLNNFYTHTRYPGREAFMAANADIESSVAALQRIAQYLGCLD